MNKLYTKCTPERYWQSLLVNAESLIREVLPASSRQAGRTIGTVLVIVDLKGFGYVFVILDYHLLIHAPLHSVSQFWQMKSLAQKSFQISQDYFPETLVVTYTILLIFRFADNYVAWGSLS
jgi:hypothetical protein